MYKSNHNNKKACLTKPQLCISSINLLSGCLTLVLCRGTTVCSGFTSVSSSVGMKMSAASVSQFLLCATMPSLSAITLLLKVNCRANFTLFLLHKNV